ncbi:MAG: hypothetical protein ABFR75_07420 [Acidobacteriota bacterium]
MIKTIYQILGSKDPMLVVPFLSLIIFSVLFFPPLLFPLLFFSVLFFIFKSVYDPGLFYKYYFKSLISPLLLPARGPPSIKFVKTV